MPDAFGRPSDSFGSHLGVLLAIFLVLGNPLGDFLESYTYREDDGDTRMECVIVIATRKYTGERNVVLIAQGE